MQGTIEKFDDLGRGILYYNNKITFIPKTCPGDTIEFEIIKEYNSFNEGRLKKIIIPSNKRIIPKCIYYDECGGCLLQHISYKDTINYKINRINYLLHKYEYDIVPVILENPHPYNYRNKISLKVVNKKIGLYKYKSNELVPIKKCSIVDNNINNILSSLNSLNIINGTITIKTNNDNHILLDINSKDKININNVNVDGIVLNNKLIYGTDTIIEEINGIKYQTSYDSFFQVNPYVACILFDTIKKYIDKNDNVLDLYCGVGAISLQIASICQKVTGVEIVSNAIKNAIYNAKINNITNTKFVLNDSSKAIKELNDYYDCIIVDPPRSGLAKDVCTYLCNSNAKKIIYVSCNPDTLFRDLAVLKEKYSLYKIFVFDMFSFTEHCESVCILERR